MLEIVLIISLCPLIHLVHLRAALSSEAESHGHNSVRVARVCSPRHLLILGLLILVLLRGVISLIAAQFLVRCIVAFMADLVSRGLHHLVNAFVKRMVVSVHFQVLPMVDPGQRLVVVVLSWPRS